MTNPKDLFTKVKREIYCFADSPPLCQKLLDGGAKVIQMRVKNADDKRLCRLAKEMLELVRHYKDRILIINDRADIALKVAADGVHLGQNDGNYREIIPQMPKNMIVGVSVDFPEEATYAERLGATYVGAGSVFPSPTKSDAYAMGINGLYSVVKAVNIPVVAIGGISIQNISKIADSGAKYFAVISDINNAPDIPAKLNEFFKKIRKE